MKEQNKEQGLESIQKEGDEKDYERLGRALVTTMINDNILVNYKWRRFILINFSRGLIMGFGSVIGATLLVALVIWTLNMFGALPVIGEWFNALGGAIEDSNLID